MSARDRRDQRREVPVAERSAEQHAFAQGRRAVERPAVPPYRDPNLRAAWLKGHTYETNLRSGLRPLDTARRLP